VCAVWYSIEEGSYALSLHEALGLDAAGADPAEKKRDELSYQVRASALRPGALRALAQTRYKETRKFPRKDSTRVDSEPTVPHLRLRLKYVRKK
jgi:hypothetical protein